MERPAGKRPAGLCCCKSGSHRARGRALESGRNAEKRRVPGIDAAGGSREKADAPSAFFHRAPRLAPAVGRERRFGGRLFLPVLARAGRRTDRPAGEYNNNFYKKYKE